MPTSNTTIGERIASLRGARGLTQSEVASALGLEHKQVVSALEKGDRALKAVELGPSPRSSFTSRLWSSSGWRR